MDETRPEKMSVMQNDSQMYCRRNMRRLDLVSKLTTDQPSFIQRAKRNFQTSFETSSLASTNNSLTSRTNNAFNSISQELRAQPTGEKVKSTFSSLSQYVTNISQNTKTK